MESQEKEQSGYLEGRDALTTEECEKLLRLKSRVEAMKSGNAGILTTGEIVDRRERPEAMEYESRKESA